MKIVAYVSDSEVMCSMSLNEVSNIADEGGSNCESFSKKTGFNTFGCGYIRSANEIEKCVGKIIPISDIYKRARETLSAYSDLKSKFESIRNQLNVLLGKMEPLTPKEETKK